jgi:hypothetical protein
MMTCKSAVSYLLFFDEHMKDTEWARPWMIRAYDRFLVPPMLGLSLVLDGRAVEVWCERYLERRRATVAA